MERRSFMTGLAALFGGGGALAGRATSAVQCTPIGGGAVAVDRFIVKLWLELTKGGIDDIDFIKRLPSGRRSMPSSTTSATGLAAWPGESQQRIGLGSSPWTTPERS